LELGYHVVCVRPFSPLDIGGLTSEVVMVIEHFFREKSNVGVGVLLCA
jgi:hypothetical protein